MGSSLRRLVASRAEGSRVAAILDPARSEAGDAEAGEFAAGERNALASDRYLLLGGPEATPARFLAEAPRFAVLHVAAHGFASFFDPAQGALALSPRGGSDGLLTYRDVLRLPLQADLAVLSACDTGIGRELPGEGLLSLARAFTLAGSRSVVASLWPVEDRQTGETMSAFYRHYLAGGMSVPDALRAAKLEALAAPRPEHDAGSDSRFGERPEPAVRAVGRRVESADPWYWAPFVCVGPLE
jgi:CHAT domain-containing protein